MTFFRPTGAKELELVKKSGWASWPPRLPDQPIFYPVTTYDRSEKIARDWNSVLPEPENYGFVTEFKVGQNAVQRYPVQDSGEKAHTELWVPAEDLKWFNTQIHGRFRVVACYRNGQRVSMTQHTLSAAGI